MKMKFISIILFLIFSTKAIAHTDHYKDINILEYELFRKSKSIGFHNFKFERKKNYLNVKSIIKFKITKLGVDLYNYSGNTEEEFKNGQLIKFSSNTNQNKKIKNTIVILDRKKNELIISGSENKLVTAKENPVGTWWDHEIVQAKAQISAVSGRVIDQKVIFLGKEELKLNGKIHSSQRFNFTSTDKNLPEKKRLNIDVWYDDETKIWLKAAFNKTGYWEYKLKKIN